MITANEMVATLNEIFAADPTATHALIINRVPCNRALADHPHVIVDELGTADRTVLGVIGVLNGMLSASGSPDVVAYEFEDQPAGSGTSRNALTGFRVVPRQD